MPRQRETDEDDRFPDDQGDDDATPSVEDVFRGPRLGSHGRCTHRCDCGAELRCPDADRCEVPHPYRCPTCQRRDDEAELDAMAKYYGEDQ